MAGSINKVILIGNLGKDPEVRRLENGSMVATFSIATSEVYTDKTSGEKKEITDWHDIVLWRGLAEITEKYVKKGFKVYIEGKIKKRTYQDKEGITRNITEIIADTMNILSRPENTNKNNENRPPYSSEGTPTPPSRLDELLSPDKEDLPF